MSEDQAEEKFYTLTEVSNKINVSMPTLQRYKKLYQDRIPSHGVGRSQRYPEEALKVFLELKEENMGKRGRPRKNASGEGGSRPRKASSGSTARADGLLTLTQISEVTGISYPTLLRYVKTNLNQIPHKGTGRARRFLPEAVEVFRSMRESSRRGRKKGSGDGERSRGGVSTAAYEKLMGRIRELEKSHKQLEKMIAKQQKLIEKPFKVVLQRK